MIFDISMDRLDIRNDHNDLIDSVNDCHMFSYKILIFLNALELFVDLPFKLISL